MAPTKTLTRMLLVAAANMKAGDFESALRFAKNAKRLCRWFPLVSPTITICLIHRAARVQVPVIETDWYEVLRVDRFADEATVRIQFYRQVSVLIPDQDKVPCAEAAFQLIAEGHRILTDPILRQSYDAKYRSIMNGHIQCPFCGYLPFGHVEEHCDPVCQ